jgi:hypothetical protein
LDTVVAVEWRQRTRALRVDWCHLWNQRRWRETSGARERCGANLQARRTRSPFCQPPGTMMAQATARCDGVPPEDQLCRWPGM